MVSKEGFLDFTPTNDRPVICKIRGVILGG